MSRGSRDSGMGRTVGSWPSSVGHTGCPGDPGDSGTGSKDSGIMPYTVGHKGPVRDVPGVPGL